MPIEVELKAHIDNAGTVSRKVRDIPGLEFSGSYIKSDTYFSSPDEPLLTQFRLRVLEDTALVTKKRKTIQGGIEVNEEIEFSVSDPEAFTRFALESGYVISIRKEKRGEAYHSGNFTLEISDVAGLGSFIELEFLLEEFDAVRVEQAKTMLLETLNLLGISRDYIEPRYYTEMLREMNPLSVN
ncbi:MAG: class IV adenylate cyclase [Spirochaetia bacterium]|nr:class IV adenylate cyclase [Spirochaetia bacterium]